MNYGTSSYGSASLGGNTASEWFIFLAYMSRAIAAYDAEGEFAVSDPYFSLFLRKSNELTDVTVEAFTRNDLNETPQSQGTFNGLFAQHVIPSARFISIRATLNDSDLIEVRGRAGS